MSEGVRDSRDVDRLSSDFQGRYDAAFHWSRACSVLQGLTAIRGAWPMSGSVIVGGNPLVADIAGGGFHLSRNSNPTHGVDGLAPDMNFDGTNDELYYVNDAQFNIVGTELHVRSAQRGLTLGGWFNFDDNQPLADIEHLAGIWSTVAGDRAYRIRRNTDGTFTFEIYDGAVVDQITSTVVGDNSKWYYVVGQYDPSTEITIWVNDANNKLERIPNTTSIPAALNVSTANFTLGAILAGTDDRLDGRESLVWLCAADLPDRVIKSIYHQQRAMFNI